MPETISASSDKVSREEMLRFFSVLSHDLKSPIFSIDGFSELLIADYAPAMDADGQDFLRRIRSSAQQMKRVLDDMSHMVKLLSREAGRRSVDLNEVLEELRLKLSGHLDPSQVQLNVNGTLPTVTADPEMLREALAALLKNAASFNDRPAGERLIEISAEDAGERIRIHVRDNGIGVDPRYIAQLFDLGIKLDKSRGSGPGYGLYLARKVAEIHDGALEATSEPGAGSTFTLSLPKS